MPLAARLVPDLDSFAGRAQAPAGAGKTASVPATVPLSFAIIADRAAFDALEADWNDLFQRAGRSHQVFLTFNWLWHWCNHYLPRESGVGATELAILTVRREGRLVMVWPLVRERAHGLTILSWAGNPVSQYGDVLAEEGPSTASTLRQAWDFLVSHVKADVVRLRKVRADATITPLLAELDACVTQAEEAPYLDFSEAHDYACYEQRYSGSARRNRRRQFRRLDEQGKVTFEELTSGPEARRLIHLAIDLKRKWLSARGLVSKAYADDRFGAFFADVAGAEEKPAGCRVAVLRTAGTPIAIEVAIACKDRMALHIIVFDLAFEKSGAGVLLMEQSLRVAANNGFACYDMLAPGDAYKRDWADGTVVVCDFAMPLSAKGRIYARAYLDFAHHGAKRLLAAMPAGLRSRASRTLSRLIRRA